MALTFDDTQSAVLLTLLGLPEDTDDADLVVETVRDAAVPPAAGHGRRGTVGDRSSSQETRPRNARHRHHAGPRTRRSRRPPPHRAAAQAKVEATVDAAIDNGKITPGRRKHWVSLIAADSGMADVLASIPDETAVPLSEIGHSAAESDTQLTPEGGPHWFY